MRFELEGRVTLDRWSFTTIYGRYAPQPALGFLTEREGILGVSSLRLNTNWSINAGIGYDLDAQKVDQTQFGLTYIDDCIALALQYITSNSYSGNPQEKAHAVMFTLGLRTLWDAQVSQKVEGLPGGL
jgi:LPS-assembly protein